MMAVTVKRVGKMRVAASAVAREPAAESKSSGLLLQRKMIYSTSEVKLAMKLLLGEKNEAKQVRRGFFSKEDGEGGDKFVPVNAATIAWAYHVFDRMSFEPSWRIKIG